MHPDSNIAQLIDSYSSQILRQPSFHRVVGRIHRAVNEKQYGRNPNEPLRPGEATGAFQDRDDVQSRRHIDRIAANPNVSDGRASSFFQHFRDEIRNQVRGKPTDISEPPRGKK